METLETSRKESRVLIPGGGADGEPGEGGGGGDGHGDVLEAVLEAGLDDVDDDSEGGGVNGPVAPGTIACFRSS